MKKKMLLVILGFILFVGNVKALTFNKVVESYKEKVLNNEMFKEQNDKISISNTDNSITTHFDLSEAEVEELTEMDVVFNYKDGKLTYEYNGELKNEIDESKYLINSILANLMYYTIGDLNGYSEEQMQNTLTEEKTKSFTLDKNGIEISLLKYAPGLDEEDDGNFNVTVGFYFTKSFNLDINKFNIGEKRDHAVYLEFSEVAEQSQKNIASLSDLLEVDCEVNNTDSEINVSCSKNERNTKVVFKYSNNLIAYDLSSTENFYDAADEMVVAEAYSGILLRTIATLNKYSDEDFEKITNNVEKASLEKNGFELTYKEIKDSNSKATGLSNIKIDLTKFNLDNLIEDEKKDETVTGEKCSEKDGLYFDKNGNSVSKEAYFENCGVVENPKTGLMIPIVILSLFGIMGISLIIKRKTYFENI